VNNGSISDGNVVFVFSDPVPERADLKVDTFQRAREKDLLAAVPRSSLMQRLSRRRCRTRDS